MMGSEHLGQLHHDPPYIFFGYASILFLGIIVLSRVCRMLLRWAYVRASIAITCIGYTIAVVLPLIIGYFLDAKPSFFGVALLAAVCVVSSGLDHIPLFAKLGRTPQEGM